MKKLMTIILALVLSVAAGAQNAKTLYEEGKAFYDAEQYDKAVPKLRAAADKGHRKAQYRLGMCYKEGYSVEKDRKKAFDLFLKSAKQDYAKAQYQLGRAYLKGKGVAADQTKAKTWLKKAVNDEKHGKEILDKIRKKAAEGDEDAKTMLALLGKK
jgi:TPR repeat protein